MGNARPTVTLKHFTELAETKGWRCDLFPHVEGTVLMRGEVDLDRMVSSIFFTVLLIPESPGRTIPGDTAASFLRWHRAVL